MECSHEVGHMGKPGFIMPGGAATDDASHHHWVLDSDFSARRGWFQKIQKGAQLKVYLKYIYICI